MRLSYQNPLTSVYNRRYADIHFKYSFNSVKNRNERIGINNINIDTCKLINNTYCHSHSNFILMEYVV